MIIIDNALRQRQEEGNPVRVAMVGAGFMGRGIALQICNYVPGMELVAS
jgi:predicted homoserine dehydrogenase-like protein